MKLNEHVKGADPAVAIIILALADKAIAVKKLLHTTIHSAATHNQYGELQLELDKAADELWVETLRGLSEVKAIVSEEREGILETGRSTGLGVALDPMDGVSSMETNLSLGPIFGIFKDGIMTGPETTIIAAMYILYGPLTTLVYSVGKGSHEFVLQDDGSWLLRRENITIPEGKIYVPSGTRSKYVPEHEQLMLKLERDGYKIRCVGAMVADVNNILTHGGFYCYPALRDAPDGKIRLLFECLPMAFIVEQAGGYASDGIRRMLDVTPAKAEQRSPIYIGSRALVQSIHVNANGGKSIMQPTTIIVPADVPEDRKAVYTQNYLTATKGTGRLMLFAGDQKLEHLNDDFYGKTDVEGTETTIPLDDADPEHLFKIASQATIGVFASQLGLIARYAPSYPHIPYLVKLNSKTHLVKTAQKDPSSKMLWDVEDVMRLKQQAKLNIVAVGFTVYVGSEYDDDMMREAAQIAFKAHQHGLLALFWMYPRGKAVPNEKDPHLIAGAAGVGACLGADFVKVNYPKPKEGSVAEAFKEAITAAGRVGVITSGGGSKAVRQFLQETWDQIHISGARGNATGRNVHQKPLADAIRMANALSAITFGNKDVDFAEKVYKGEAQFVLGE